MKKNITRIIKSAQQLAFLILLILGLSSCEAWKEAVRTGEVNPWRVPEDYRYKLEYNTRHYGEGTYYYVNKRGNIIWVKKIN